MSWAQQRSRLLHGRLDDDVAGVGAVVDSGIAAQVVGAYRSWCVVDKAGNRTEKGDHVIAVNSLAVEVAFSCP